jgi:hypothetical protein
MGTFAAAWTPNPLPHQRHRRSLYALKLRGLSDPFLEVFNAPGPDFSCERRDESSVTPQVFSLFNGQFSHARALALANRAVTATATDNEAITFCFGLAYGRAPVARELDLCIAHWRDGLTIAADAVQWPVPPRNVLREAIEENTGERFLFHESLPSNAEFVSDLQPRDVPVRVRALADVCLALFNSSEFLYVY